MNIKPLFKKGLISGREYMTMKLNDLGFLTSRF